MPSQFKQDNPGCDCCEFQCEDCNPVTTVAISIPSIACDGTLADPGLPMCTRNNGTYVFRTSWTNTALCRWRYLLSGEACFGDSTFYAQYNTGCGALGGDYFVLDFLAASGGGVTVRVTIERGYSVQDTFPFNAAQYTFVFEDTFEACADAIGATLPFVSKTVTVCTGSDPGDICDIEGSAVVTLG